MEWIDLFVLAVAGGPANQNESMNGRRSSGKLVVKWVWLWNQMNETSNVSCGPPQKDKLIYLFELLPPPTRSAFINWMAGAQPKPFNLIWRAKKILKIIEDKRNLISFLFQFIHSTLIKVIQSINFINWLGGAGKSSWNEFI